MYRMTDEEFEAAVEEALDAMPEQFLEALQNIVIVWEDEPNAYHLYGEDPEEAWNESEAADRAEDNALPDDLLGLFDGLSIVERANGLDDDIPDVITVFKGPHERCFASREEIVEEIGKTIIHELGHYFGLEDDKLYDMGY